LQMTIWAITGLASATTNKAINRQRIISPPLAVVSLRKNLLGSY
jgi:hypothetical protein